MNSMIYIAHRGNTMGKNFELENSIEYVEKAFELNFHAEVDLWLHENEFYLGHDKPQYSVDLTWLFQHRHKLWIHAKNLGALDCLTEIQKSGVVPGGFNFFWHQNDDYTLTSLGFIWAYPGVELGKKFVQVMPEWNCDITKWSNPGCFAVCSDFVGYLKEQ